MKKKYIKTIEDLLALKDTDKKIYAECEGGYYQFIDGVLCAFDDDDDGWTMYPTLNDQEELYILEEDPIEEATEKDLYKLYEFSNDNGSNSTDILLTINRDDSYPYYSKATSCWWKHCRVLTEEDFKKIQESK